jgi:hypothetical protein
VFNVEQIEGLPAQYHAVAEPRLDPVQRIERAEAFFAATRADIRHSGNMAYYNIGSDFVHAAFRGVPRFGKCITRRWRMTAPIMPRSGLCRMAGAGGGTAAFTHELVRHNVCTSA